jgi:hypothetical protein
MSQQQHPGDHFQCLGFWYTFKIYTMALGLLPHGKHQW